MQILKAKTPKESIAITTDIVLTAETNHYDNMFGGDVLSRLDKAGYISATRHSGVEVMTASVNHVTFNSPIPLGSVVTFKSIVSRAFKTSMEVIIEIWCEYPGRSPQKKISEAIFTYVAIGKNGIPQQVPPISPETEEEQQRFDAALRRRQLSLVLAKKMKPKEATELKSIFS